MTTPPPPSDRLHALLPYIYRLRDGERGGPLRTFLRAIEEQVAVLEADLDRLYDNWFIETCDQAMVPYIGQLVGWTATARAGEPGEVQAAEGFQLRRTLAPRADVARTLAHRRRKGTLALLEELARTVAGWPAHAVELYRLLSYTQPLNHQRPERGRTAALRDGGAMAVLDGPFDRTAHTADVRRASSIYGRGRYNIPSVGVFVWRTRSWPVTRCQAYLQEGIVDRDPRSRRSSERGCFHFNVLGVDTPLFVHPEAEPDSSTISAPQHVPGRLTRRLLHDDLARYYGPDKSVCIWLSTGQDGAAAEPVPAAEVTVADLSEWLYAVVPDSCTVLLDPELGRFKVRRPRQQGRRFADDTMSGARVSYHHGFAAAIGGGEYDRDLVATLEPHTTYVVGDGDGELPTLHDALTRWGSEAPDRAIIEVATRDVQRGPVRIGLREHQVLILRAADRYRTVLRLVDDRADARDTFMLAGERGSRFVCDGFVVSGRSVAVAGPLDQVVFRHCTLVPPERSVRQRPSGPAASLILDGIAGDVTIERSIMGPVAVTSEGEPMRIAITGSVIDAGNDRDDAFSDGPSGGFARALLTVRTSTVFGRVTTHALALAENSLFSGVVRVARRQPGCVRFCHVPLGSRTPPRHHCQPDLVLEAVDRNDRAARLAALDRVWPLWASRQYGDPAYAQLWRDVAREISRGADDESEMGVMHDLYWPQREDALSQRLNEYVPASVDAGLFFVT